MNIKFHDDRSSSLGDFNRTEKNTFGFITIDYCHVFNTTPTSELVIIVAMLNESCHPAARAPVRPELLAPAGDWDCVRAAIENGADAIYFGLDCGFNARARAANFPLADLPNLMSTLHRRGVKGYTTLNTLAFSQELAELENVIRTIASAGVDAVLVQDMGVARLIRAICPELPIHASTQMTITSAESIEWAEALGIERIVLARELSIDEIVKIREHTSMPLEVFVHGALCVAYSGQCLTSESLGGRSANRGQCAQACRLTYDLICDGREVDLGEQKYLLSPQDLAAYALAPELIEAGICSFKIEGRLKTAEYVANITRHYRAAIDHALQGLAVEFTPQAVEEMELSFSRGFSPGWLEGNDHKMLVPGISSAKRGVLLGEIVGLHRQRVAVQLRGSIKRGDGISFAGGRSENEEQGGRVYEVFRNGYSLTEPIASGVVELSFKHETLDFSRLHVGQHVWKTDDPELTQRLRKSFSSSEPQRKTPLHITVVAAPGQPLQLTARTEQGLECRCETPEFLAPAREHGLTTEILKQQLGRLGQTPWELKTLTANITGNPMAPFSVLGKLRHQLVAKLEQLSVQTPPRTVAAEPVLPNLRATIAAKTAALPIPAEATLHVLCRTLPQLEAVLQTGEKNLYVDFADIREYRQAVERAREHQASLILATPRIQKPGEMGVFQALAKQKPTGILVRNLGAIHFFRERGLPLVGDFSLNVTNELSAELFLQAGISRVTASYDMNREQLLDLVAHAPPAWLEVVIHQHMPMFHMEHCVFCSVLSPGTNKSNCGRPCDTHTVQLRDRLGMQHLLTADVGCRNTLFNATPQSAAEVVPALLSSGVRHFRVELLDESATEIAAMLQLYRRLLRAEVTGIEVWKTLQASNRVGVTRGTLEERRNPLAIL
jgi:U32 family peptidase